MKKKIIAMILASAMALSLAACAGTGSAPDENGNSTYYLYFNEAGTRIKLSDIEALNNQIKKGSITNFM